LLGFGKKPLKKKDENGGETTKMKLNLKKSLKIATLLISSLLIAVASAQIYSYMYIKGSASITTGGLSWALGTSAPSGATVDGYTVNNLNFSVPENTFQNFTDSLELTNNDATSHTFDLATTITSGNAADFTTFDMIVYNSAGDRLATVDITTAGSATGIAIAASPETLLVRFEIQPVTDVSSGSLDFTIQLTYT
jgi:hypothetical protein